VTALTELIKLYSQAQVDLINMLIDKAARGTATQYTQSLLYQVNRELTRLTRVARPLIDEIAYQEIQRANAEIQKELADVGATFAMVPTRQIEIMADNLSSSLSMANANVGRRINDAIRRAGIEASAQLQIGAMDVKTAKESMMQTLADKGLVSVQYANGANMSLDAYAAMVVRTTTREAVTAQRIEQCLANGIDLIKMDKHAPTCPVCAKYQDRVYALTQEAAHGKYDGLEFPFAYDTVFESGYLIVHPNCSHNFSPYPAEVMYKSEMRDMSQRSLDMRDTRSEAEQRRYNQAQANNREVRRDMKEYDAIRALVPDKAPKSFGAYRTMRRHKSERWQELMSLWRETQ